MEHCLNCDKEVIQPRKGKKKLFCNDSCRSNFWQKNRRKISKLNLEQPSVPDTPIKVTLKGPEQPKTTFDGVFKNVKQLQEHKWLVKERPQPPGDLSGTSLQFWKDNHK